MKFSKAYPLAATLLVSACGDTGSTDDSSTLATTQESSTSTLSISLTDAPIDEASQVFVTIQGVSLNYEDSGWVDYDLEEVKKVDLLTLQSGTTLSLLDDIEIVPGQYQVRLNLHDDGDQATFEHSIVLSEGGLEYGLFVPSGAQTGLKLNSSITVPANGSANYTIDFDVRKSIVHRGQEQDYILKPVLTLIDNTVAGSITGVIEDSTLLTTDCSDDDPVTHNAVYVYDGFDATPDDIGSAGTEPVVTALVHFNEVDGVFEYHIPFVLAGDYTVALTCNADQEDIEADDELNFKAISNQTVEATPVETGVEDESETEVETEEAAEVETPEVAGV